jgi:hypothetical protein
MKAYPEYALSMKPHKHARRMAAGLYERGHSSSYRLAPKRLRRGRNDGSSVIALLTTVMKRLRKPSRAPTPWTS